MNTHSKRGDATLILVGILGLAALLGWSKPWKLFTSKPPLVQLADAQLKLDAANAKAKAAEDALAAAQAADAKAKQDQLQYAQEMVHGTASALAVAPASPAIQVAISTNTRAETSLSAALGSLPPALAVQIDGAVKTALAAKDHEIEVLNAALAQRDSDLKQATQERDSLKVQIPLLASKVASAEQKVESTQALVTAKQEQVNAYAAKAAEADKATFGWQGLYNGIHSTLIWVGLAVFLAAVGYIFVHFILPSLAQEYPNAPRLQKAYRTITSFASAHKI